MNSTLFDIIVVGGGHAGIEAAYIANQFNLSVALITMPGVPLAATPCNPSIGGVGKGQLVRELDALGGLVPILSDLSGVQYRNLNESKGYAVQSTRVQIDKHIYSKNAENILASLKNLEIIYDKVTNFVKDKDSYVTHTKNAVYHSRALIITVGTFLNGKLHCGEKMASGGSVGHESAVELGDFLKSIKTVNKRFKTGTPPRLYKKSIDFSKLMAQPSDPEVLNFHCLHHENKRTLPQVPCYLTETNEKTLKIIRDNKERSPLFNGQIKGIGPRYCPSIEDKAFRYPDKNIHHVFLEPESSELDTIYPSGLSTSLPLDVQEAFVKTVDGLEEAQIKVPGYAVEYDVLDTTFIKSTLEHKEFDFLYFAGQINGTSGYEEASGQGYVAGVNACLKLLNKKPLIFSRHDSYIGVMISDLVTNKRDEPYRLFTARSENRLYLREDNAVLRMAPYRKSLALNHAIDEFNNRFLKDYELLEATFSKLYFSPDFEFLKNFSIKLSKRTALVEILKQPSLDPVSFITSLLSHFGFIVPRGTIRAFAISKRYEGYITRADSQYAKIKNLDKMKLSWEDLIKSPNISFECKQRINEMKPLSFGDLKLIEGIRPATLAVVASGSL